MPFFNFYPTKDTFITNKSIDGTDAVRATGSNLGAVPNLSIFAQKAVINSSSIELARSLLDFNISELSGKIYSEKTIPSSSVSYFLKMFNLEHDQTVPTSYDLFVYPLSRSFDEGSGIDEDDFQDLGYANWNFATSITQWTNTGSDFITSLSASQHFDQGTEDLEVDITSIMNAWLTGGLSQNGLLVKMGDTEETNDVNYFIKKFHSSETKFVDRLPYIQARWSDVLKDNRGNFGYNVPNTLVMYNFIRGELTTVSEPVTVRVQDSLISASASYTQTFPAYQIAPGIVTASIFIDNSASFSSSFYDIWFSGSRVYLTSSFTPLSLTASQVDPYSEFVVSISNLKRIYSVDEEARLKAVVRKRDYKTHMGIVATSSLDVPKEYVEKMYYSIENEETGEVIIPFGTGSINFTQLSYNNDGNYFDIFFKSFVPGLIYRIKFLIDINQKDKKVLDSDLLFKVI